MRRGLRTGEQAKTVQMLRDEGVAVEVSMLDVAERAQAQQLLALCEAMAPVGGIFHLAMVLDDRLIAKHVRVNPTPSCLAHAGSTFHLTMVLEDCLIAKHVCIRLTATSLENAHTSLTEA